MAIKFLNSTNTDSGVLYVDADNNKVGIGTTTPSKQLQVRGSAPWIRIEEDSVSNKRLDLWVDPSSAIAYVAANQSAQQLSFQTASTDRIRILNNGYVGVGTTSPTTVLNVYSPTINRVAEFTSGDNGALIEISDNDTTSYIGSEGTLTYIGQTASASSNNLIINSSGRVGIGTTSPDSKLSIKAAAGEEGIKIRNVNNQDTFHLGHLSSEDSYFQMKNNAGTTQVLFRTDNNNSYINTGNVGIRTTAPTSPLQVGGYNFNSDAVKIYGYSNNAMLSLISRYDQASGGLFFKRGNNGIESTIGQINFVSNQFRIDAAVGSLNIQTSGTSAIAVDSSQNIQFSQYGAGYLKTDASGNVSVDNSTFLTAEADTLDSVTDRGNSTTNAITTGSITATSSSYVRMRVDQTDSALIDMGVSSAGAEGFLNVQNTGSNHSTDDPELKLLLNTTEYARLNSTGLGIGTTNPSQKLQVNGIAYATSSFQTGGSAMLKKYSSGWSYPTHDVVYNAWTSSIGDYTYLKAAGNSDVNHGIVVTGDNGFFVGRTNLETGGLADSSTDPIDVVWMRINSTGSLSLPSYTAGLLKTDANGNVSLDTSTYLTSYTETDTLDSVTDRGNDTTNPIVLKEAAQSNPTGVDGAVVIDYQNNGTDTGRLRSRDWDAGVWEDFQIEAADINLIPSGNVGIGTTSPTSKLHVDGQALVTGTITTSNGSGGGVNYGSTSYKIEGGSYFGDLRYTAPRHRWYEGSDFVMTIDGGNVGIGTATPGSLLEVSKDSTSGQIATYRNNTGYFLHRTYADYNNDGATVEFQQRIGVDGNYSRIGNYSNHPLYLMTNNSTNLTLLTNGNVGIGTAAPSKKLDVRGEVAFDVMPGFQQAGAIRIGRSDGTSRYHEILAYNDSDSSFNYLRFQVHNGTVGSNVNTLELKGDGVVKLPQYGAGLLKTDSSGNVSLDTNTYLTSYTETQTLDDVTDLGNGTTNSISVGAINLSDDPASNNGTFVKVYSDEHKRMYVGTLDFSFTAAGTYNFNLVFPNSGGYQYDLTAVNSRSGLYRNFGTLRDSSYIYWESDEDFTHRAEGDVHLISSYSNGMYFSADTTYFLSDGVTDAVQTGTANWSYAIVRYSVYIPYHAGDTTGTWKLHLTTYGDTGSSVPQFVLA